jgi:hypothetical protein
MVLTGTEFDRCGRKSVFISKKPQGMFQQLIIANQ